MYEKPTEIIRAEDMTLLLLLHSDEDTVLHLYSLGILEQQKP